jgi:hypothetical protein
MRNRAQQTNGDKDWTPYLRDFKLGIITGDREINPCQKSLNKFDEQLTFIKDEFPNDIITGSLGLNIFGFLDREISDIDILIKDRERYSQYNSGEYYRRTKNNELDMERRLGYLEIKHRKRGIWGKLFPKKYKVDFFEDKGTRYSEVKYKGHVYKVQHPIDIIETKITLEGSKHYRDIYCILQ